MSTFVKGILASLILWMILGFSVSLVGSMFFIPTRLKDLVKNGRQIYGKVLNREAEDSRRIDFTFKVAGEDYTGSGYEGFGNGTFDELTPGTTVWVTYDPVNPSISYLGLPAHEISYREQTISAVAIGVPFWPVLILLLIYIGISKTRQKQEHGRN